MYPISVPRELRRFARGFHQDIELVCPVDDGKDPTETWVSYALRFVTEEEQIVLKEFLLRVLAEEHSEDELLQMWLDAGPDMLVRPVRMLFTTAVRLIG